MNSSLIRQLKRSIGIKDEAEFNVLLSAAAQGALSAESVQRIVLGLGNLLTKVDATYLQYERDLELRTRSLELSSAELSGANDKLRLEVAERKQVEINLQLAASVFSHAREGIIISDANGIIVDVNDSFTRITGFTREDAIGQSPRILKSGHHPPEFYENMWKQLAESGHWKGEVWNRRKSGEIYADMRTISAMRDSAGKIQNYVALFSDITPMKQQQLRLERMAHFDGLTGLPNRVLLADRLQQAMALVHRSKTSLAVAFLDLDGFKAINDKYGHALGDEFLIALAQRLKTVLREGDTLARLGGDEFVVVLVAQKGGQDFCPIVGRILQAAAGTVTIGGTALKVTASVGISVYPQDDSDADQLIRHADQAMYIAKQAGKNRYHFFDVERHVAVKSEHETVESLRLALSRREFVLYFQPKVNMRSGQVVGAEALIRWQHPKLGLLAPGMFLPVIENHSFSIELGEWVIETALTQVCLWRAAGLDIPVSVNVGARQLQQDNFPARLGELLGAFPALAPACLELEILETSAFEDMSRTSSILHACRDLGVRFALDDFGTGYSSLTYLKRLPVEVLKIDQSFVLHLLDDQDNQSIIEGIIGLAVAFHREMIAEGVETVEHGERLLALGCDTAQGYGIARPMSGCDLPNWAANWQVPASWKALARE